jgi:hypothetical protein
MVKKTFPDDLFCSSFATPTCSLAIWARSPWSSLFREEAGRRVAANLRTRDKARRIAANIAKLPQRSGSRPGCEAERHRSEPTHCDPRGSIY